MEDNFSGKFSWMGTIVVAILGAVLLYSLVYVAWVPKRVVTDQNQYVKNEINQVIETADWKTYRNDEYGFEFQYPPNYALNGYETKYADSGGIGFIDTTDNSVRDEVLFVYISDKDIEVPSSPSITNDKYRFTFLGDSHLKSEIISTFKFTESVNTPTWKTYYNNERRFSLEHPINWDPGEVGSFGVFLEGEEGIIEIRYKGIYGIEYCGGVEEQIELMEEQFHVCHQVKDDGSESWIVTGLGERNKIVTIIAHSKPSYRETVLQILSTFKFTDQNTWKTYRNDECGFEMQTPQDWVPSNVNKSAFGELCEGFGFAPVDLKDVNGDPADLFIISVYNHNFNEAAEDMYVYQNGKLFLDCLKCYEKAEAYLISFGNLRGLATEDHISYGYAYGTVYRLTGFLTNEKLSAQFEMSGPDDEHDIASKYVFDHILSTFKFTR